MCSSGFQSGQQRLRNDLGAFSCWMNSVPLNGSWNVDQVFVDHGNESDVVLGGKRFEYLIELLDVVRAVVRRQSDSGQQNFNVCGFKCGNDLIEIAAGLFEG